MIIKNFLQHLSGTIVLIGLIALTATVTSCFDDDMYDTIKNENNYEEPVIEQAHTTYFPLTRSGYDRNDSIPGDDYSYITTLLYPDFQYEENITGVIEDKVTQLEWIKCSLIESGTPDSIEGDTPDNASDCSGTHKIYTHNEAKTACENLNFAGYSDWRLPTSPELFSLYDFGEISPATDMVAFPNTEEDGYWSASELRFWSSDCAFVIFFKSVDPIINISDFHNITNYHYVRCVR